MSGNILRRSGVLKKGESFHDQNLCCHLRMKNCSGTVIVTNSMAAGKDDGGTGIMTPDYSCVITDCTECIIKNNVLYKSALKENFVLYGENSTCVIYDNIGRLQTDI